MVISRPLRKRGIQWLLWFVCWTFIGLSFAFQFYISSAKAGLDVSWKQAISYALGDWYVFALLSIPVITLARRFRFESGSRMPNAFVHVCGCFAFSFAYIVLRAWVGTWQSTGGFSNTMTFTPARAASIVYAPCT